MASNNNADMFGPPIARGMRALDRSYFKKTIPLMAARILDNKNISKVRAQLSSSKDILDQERLDSVHSDPDPTLAKAGKKCILLRPQNPTGVAVNEGAAATKTGIESVELAESYSPVLSALIQQNLVSLVPFHLDLDYDYWTYHDVISAILPLEAHEEIPSGFSQVGHVAHMNIREQYFPYKSLIAQIILDKNPMVRTVINKIDDVGHESEFRTFKYEVLAGPDDMNVTVSEAGCTFSFDYSKVYWNTRLQTEHTRLVSSFQRGEAVCDVMAGIGPFAVPAGKKGVFVWANDLNPDSFASLSEAISRNKVNDFVMPFGIDGRQFIRRSAAELLHTDHVVEIKKKQSRKEIDSKQIIVERLEQPKIFQHYVLNLPASAITFLPSFIGLYPSNLRNLLPADAKMPLVHVYCFSVKDELLSGLDANTEKGAIQSICAEISRQLQYEMRPGNVEEAGCVDVYDVRDVAPKKRMFCATFRLPEEVAFRSPG